ncbi:hypothetical protein L915_16216 [Phytophthora nicotianae]|uniref:DUSP domain-containing protein n=1 Tax=Phytophthora nicotianae TaxID=4792 RepID=W2IC96_PHYNI|nr:hypothetical protein L915_16216 [Phytophthora nicotianae]ETL30983.1 hypothetical protein L916_16109 [Phytophthora nicotianae]
MARSYRLGDTWFVVSCGWWQRVVERGDTPTDSRIRNSDIVDAKRSCRCCSRSILHPNLMEDVDFRLVSEPVWSALSLEFGYDWAVRREVVTMGRRLGVDVYPSGLEERATGHGHIPNSEAVAPSPPSSPTREEWTPVKLEQWRSELKLDQSVDALDTDSRWYEAKIVDITDSRVKVHYRGWSVKWDEWLAKTSPRLMPTHSRVPNWRKFQVHDAVQVGEARPGKKRMLWRDGKVLATSTSLLVQIQVGDEVRWLDSEDERLCPPGTHRTISSGTNADAASSSPTSVTTMGSNGRRKRLKTSSSRLSLFDD